MAQVVKVFLASPNDLPTERALARECADQFNKNWSDQFGLYFRVVGWEEVAPTAQRPQERINKEAAECHLFIGLLGARWGTSTGAYSSGFEEEFTIARNRRRCESTPDIALFFKSLDQNQLRDPGPQLNQVLQFKNSIIEGKEFLFQEFDTLEVLRKHIDGVFANYVKSQQVSSDSKSLASDVVKKESLDLPSLSITNAETSGSTLRSVLAVADKFNDVLDEDNFWDSVKLMVFALAQYGRFRMHVSFGVHDANVIFCGREQWDLSPHEKDVLVRSFLRDAHSYIPGWYWLATAEDIGSYLLYFALHDDSGKEKAANILSAGDYVPSDDVLERLLRDPKTYAPICRLLERRGLGNHISVINKMKVCNEKFQVRHYLNAEFSIKVREGLICGVEECLFFAANGIDAARRLLVKKVERLKTSEIEVLFKKCADARSKKALVTACHDADVLTKKYAEHLLSDEDKWVKEVAVKNLIAKGLTFNREELKVIFPGGSSKSNTLLSGAANSADLDALILMSMKNWSREDLFGAVSFFGEDGFNAFIAAMECYFGEFEQELLRQLNSDFEVLIQESDKAYMERHNFSPLSVWRDGDSSALEYRRSKFIVASLDALYSRGTPEGAINWALKYFDGKYRDNIRHKAVEILVWNGFVFNSGRLGKASQLAVAGASISAEEKLIVGFVEIVAQHVSSDVRVAFRSNLKDCWGEEQKEIFERLLLSSTDRIRRFAATTICAMLPLRDVGKILDGYIELKTYYYDVVAIFDKFLYAPQPYCREIREQLLVEH